VLIARRHNSRKPAFAGELAIGARRFQGGNTYGRILRTMASGHPHHHVRRIYCARLTDSEKGGLPTRAEFAGLDSAHRPRRPLLRCLRRMESRREPQRKLAVRRSQALQGSTAGVQMPLETRIRSCLTLRVVRNPNIERSS
jgi:hypothetical protein